jgi:outer membrane protein TolC
MNSHTSFLRLLAAAVVAGGLTAPSALRAQAHDVEFTVEAAVTRALAVHRPLEAARADVDAARQTARLAAADRWPTLGFAAGGQISDDPVAVFGTRLRQRRFTQADFDIGPLNDPDPLTDLNAGLEAQWTPFDFARDAEAERARILGRAAEAGAERQAEVVVYRTRALHATARLSETRFRAAIAALEAARATRDIVARRTEEGLLMERDLLRTEAALARARSDSVRAAAALESALDRLGLHLALGADSVPVPVRADAPATMPAAERSERSDVVAQRLTTDAARTAADAARGTRLPRLEVIGRLSGHASDDFNDRGLFGTVGVAVRLPLFTGGRTGAAVDRADAAARAEELRLEETIAAARVELREAERSVAAAEAAVQAAEAATEAALEARRLTRLRLEQGLATPDAALQADADAARMEAFLVDALLNLELGRAALDLARGGLPELRSGATPAPRTDSQGDTPR